MIAVFRIRFTTNTNAASVWSDTLFENWMNIAIPFSLAHFWSESGWGLFDLNHKLFPELVISDPRGSVVLEPGDDVNAKMRGALVNGAIAKATEKFAPAWGQFDIALFWFAQPTDMFGGGSFAVPLGGGNTKNIPVTVIDIASPFDAACQELGHALGLDHELDLAGNDYGCPYSVMSMRNEGVEFLRALDPRLPDGTLHPEVGSRFFGIHTNRIAGPVLPAAQLVKFPAFGFGPRVLRVPVSHGHTPFSAVIHALDHARARPQSADLKVLALIPPKGDFPTTFGVELRRTSTGYDQGIGGAMGPAAGLVVHSFDGDGRVRYQGVLPLASPAGVTAWTSASGEITLLLQDVGAGLESARFAVAGGPLAAVLWHNASSRETQIWFIDGERIVTRATVHDQSGRPILLGPPWSIVGLGDLQGNGQSGIVWHNSASGETQFWQMSGQTIAGPHTVVDEQGRPIPVGLPWRIAGVADMNGDGKADIVWHNGSTNETQIWLMDGHKIADRRTVTDDQGRTVIVGLPWRIAGAGDVDGDGKADLVWHNGTTNETQIWLMDGHKISRRRTVTDDQGRNMSVGPPWSIVGVGDMSGNGQADITWHNSTTFETQIWQMDGPKIASRITVADERQQPIFVGPPWRVVAAGRHCGR